MWQKELPDRDGYWWQLNGEALSVVRVDGIHVWFESGAVDALSNYSESWWMPIPPPTRIAENRRVLTIWKKGFPDHDGDYWMYDPVSQSIMVVWVEGVHYSYNGIDVIYPSEVATDFYFTPVLKSQPPQISR